MNKQELIEKIIDLGRPCLDVVELVKQLDEPTKPVVPKVVIDYYGFYKGKLTDFEEWFAEFKVESDEDFQRIDEVGEWLYNVDFETQKKRELALATLIVNGLDAVEVEEEKRYLVSLKNGQPLVKTQSGKALYFNQNIITGNYKFTHKELEDADFGWVFDCPGIEIEEVE